jgi:hypothetical protein
MLARIRRAITDPALVWYRLRAGIRPKGLHRRYQRLAREQGFRRAYFLLSFDCDTDLDIAVVERVHGRLRDIGITPVYAVPGELLERGATVYRAIATTGAEFLNHGYREHTVFDSASRAYVSTVFYDRLTPEAVAQDIRRGHGAVLDVLGRSAIGFRAPHFGTYGGGKHLDYMHRVLAPLGYRFSTSSEPSLGLRLGPAPKLRSGLRELPVTGCYDQPFRMLDSWGFRFAPGRRGSQSDYTRQLGKLARHFTDARRVGLVNLYADPSQVHDWPEFFEGLRSFAGIAARSFEQVLGEIYS